MSVPGGVQNPLLAVPNPLLAGGAPASAAAVPAVAPVAAAAAPAAAPAKSLLSRIFGTSLPYPGQYDHINKETLGAFCHHTCSSFDLSLSLSLSLSL